MYNKNTLENNLRVITIPMENTRAVSVLVLVSTGSKYETKNQNGVSHFLEHMFFKGTNKRPSTLEIASALDRVGGNYNAFTSKELTGYWAKVDAGHFDLALDWVADIFLNSKLESEKIEREKGVIIEEINMYLDTPIQYIEDLWEKLLYGDQPAGWLTIGTKENVSRFKRNDLVKYLQNHYLSTSTVVCVAGNIKSKQALNKIKKSFKKIRTGPAQSKPEVMERQDEPKSLLHFKETDQTHLAVGVRGYDLFHPQRYTQSVLATMLGGNMSSRLFIEVREKRGLAYYVNASSQSATDTGYLVARAGVDHDNLEETIDIILKEYKRLKQKKVTDRELNKAKDYLKGSLTLSLESSDAQASFYSGQELLTGKILTPEQKFAKLDQVTKDNIQKTAQDLFRPENLNLALIGPHKNKEKLSSILRL